MRLEKLMRRGIIYIDDNYAEFGDFPDSRDNIRIIYEGNLVWGISYDQLKGYLGFDYYRGCYTIGKDTNQYNFPFGREAFPYNLDKTVYNAKFEEHLFKGKQSVANRIEFKFINELPYTFGLEFETAGGYLPQHKLYELGLIPLRDGSITGIPRVSYEKAEERVVGELKRLGKPFIIVLNSKNPKSKEAIKLRDSLEKRHGVSVILTSGIDAEEDEFTYILESNK